MKRFILAVLIVFTFVLCCRADIWIRYKGLDNVHLEFWDWENFPAKIEIRVVETGEVLFSQDLPAGGGNISGKIHHTGLSEGTYTYKLWADSILRSTAVVQINKKIAGELLYDETISDTAFLEDNVTVPADKAFNVNGSLVRGTEIGSNNNVYVNGTISFQGGIALQDVNIHFQGGTVSVNNVDGNGNLIFYSQSSGSTVKDCKGLGITVKENTSVSVEDSEIGGFGIEQQGTSLNISGSTIWGYVYLTKIQNFDAQDSTFLGNVNIAGGSPEFTNCEFAGIVHLYCRNSGKFSNCVFGDVVVFDDPSYITDIPKWSENQDIQPNFSNNSFAGRMGPTFNYPTVPFSPVDLGTNYYGDKKPVITSETRWLLTGPEPGWFLTRGTPIDRYHFKVTQWNSSGPGMQNQKVLPAFWVNDYVIGQNTISHLPDAYGNKKTPVLIQGRESLLSIDVATNYPDIQGVRFKAVFDGQEIQPVNSGVILRRDISGNSNDVFYGNTTVNFILPATDKESVSLVVKMDTTNISGFEDAQGKGEVDILNLDLSFNKPYGRQLNILVQPVQLYITGYTRKAPDGKGVENSLKKLIPAMLPISKQDLHIWTTPTTTFYGGVLSMLSTTALLNRIASYLAVGQGFINTTASVGDWVSGNETARVDFVVAVLPNGVLGDGITGANLCLRRGIAFVDENFSDAAIHEIGHGIGLYTWREQYDQYPPIGLPVEGITAFIPDASSASSIPGFRNRFLHFPRNGQSWYEEKYWFDIMGSSSTLIWPIESTFLAFRDYLRSTLGTKTKSAIHSYSKVPAGYKRIFVSAKTEKVEDAIYYYQMIPGTISAFEITEFATGKIDVPSEMSYWPADDYRLECLDNSGTIIHTQEFTTISPYKDYANVLDWPEESSFCGTFDIPEETKSIKIFHRLWWNVWEENPVFQINYVAPDPITITSPSSGTQLSDSVEVKWTTSETKQQSTMQYVLMVSTDGGNTWIPAGAPVESNKITIPTDFLSSSDNIVFKVIGSSGLGTTSDQVGSIVIENRPPQAVITSPQDGWTAQTGTKWLLTGYGIDNEDGTIPTGVWTSSIDGQLNTETDVVLSPGIHTLTFTVRDSGNLTDSESVVVEVKDMENIDLGLDDNNLSLYIASRDPLNSSPIVWLTQGGIHRATLRIRNTGIDTIFKASLYLTAPSSQEQLLASNYFAPEAFEEVVLSETFIVSNPGQYQIRAEITDTAPQDTNPSNNQKTWTYQTQPQSPVIGIAPDTLDFGTARARKQGLVLIQNYGNANLLITSLTISGQNSTEFSIDQSILQTSIPANTSIFIPAYFSPQSTGTKQALLTITSNDPESPMKTIEFTGSCFSVAGDISNDSVVDISDVILCLRQAIGLDPQNPALADMNEDGSIDISDVILVLRKAIGLD